jgi:enoyl-CoA hydratase/carnithine racemase
MKRAALRYVEAAEQAAIAAIPEIRASVLGTEDAAEGIRSFVERREARFSGR